MDKETGLTIKHYKEPLLPIPKTKGHGYYGCLMSTSDGERVQCHICGGLYDELQAHVRQKHSMKIPDYRERFQLSYTTALISEARRLKRKENALEMVKKMKEKYGEDFYIKAGRKGRQKRREGQPEERLESKNKKGTCPDQLLEKIKEVAKVVGHTPSLAEFMHETEGQRYKHLIFATFGSWKNALKILNMKPQTPRSSAKRRSYADDELLEYLKIFWQEQNRIPTSTDCKRGFLPSEDVYVRRFGSLPKARELAGVGD